MKISKIFKKAIVLLLGLVVYFSVASPVNAYADEGSDPWEITVPVEMAAGVVNSEYQVSLAGTWEPAKTITVTAIDEITMTCADIADSAVTAKVNFIESGVSKNGVDPEVSYPISVEAPNVVLGVWTGTITYEVKQNDFSVLSVEVTKLPDDTTYTEGETFNPEGMEVTVTYENGAVEVISGDRLAELTLPTDPLQYGENGTVEIPVTYKEKSDTVPVTVNPKLVSAAVSGYDADYIEGDLFATTGMVVSVVYQKNGVNEQPVVIPYGDARITLDAPAAGAALQCSNDSVNVTYTDENGQVMTAEGPLTVVPRLENIAVTGGNRSYVEGDPFDPTDIIVVVTYTENGETKTKTVTYPDDRISIPDDGLTADDTTVTLTYTEYGQSVEEDVTVTVLPKLDSLVISGTYDDYYYENQTFDPTGMTVQAKYIRNGVEELVDISLDDPNLTFSPSTSDLLTLANDKVTITYEDANGQTATAEASITVEKKQLVGIAISGSFDSVYGEEDPAFDPTGMVVTASYTDGSTAIIPLNDLTIGAYDFTLPDGAANKFVDIPISYTEDGVTRSATVSVEVRYYPQMLSTAVPNEYLYSMLDDSITTVEIRDDGYTPNWTADNGDYWAEAIAIPVDGVGKADDIMLYADYDVGKITIVGNGSGKILLPDNCFEMFAGSRYLTEIIGLELLDPRNTTQMMSMFKNLERMESLVIPDTWDTSNVVDMGSMFANFGRRATAPELDVSALDVTGADMTSMFSRTGLSHLDLSNFVVNEDNFIGSMFEDSTKLQKIEASCSWSMAHDGAGDTFKNCLSLIGGNGTTYIDMYPTEHIDDTAMAHIDGVDGLPGYFTFKAPSN